MRLLLDEMLDHRLAKYFLPHGHQCVSVRDAGFKGLANGELLTAAELHGFEALVTVDKGIKYQANFAGRKIAVVIICVFRNKLSSVLPYLSEALQTIESIAPGKIKYVGEPRLVAKHIEPQT